MTETIQIDSCRSLDGEELLAAFVARGLDGELLQDAAPFTYRLRSDGEGLSRHVELALEDWASSHGLPLIATRLADGGYVLRPPAG